MSCGSDKFNLLARDAIDNAERREYTASIFMTRQEILDLYFLDARGKLIELAAFLDRAGRTKGNDDFRLKAFRKALKELGSTKNNRAERVLLALSDPTTKAIPAATTKAACGAWPFQAAPKPSLRASSSTRCAACSPASVVPACD